MRGNRARATAARGPAAAALPPELRARRAARASAPLDQLQQETPVTRLHQEGHTIPRPAPRRPLAPHRPRHMKKPLKPPSIASLINGQQRLLVELAHDLQTPDRSLRGRRLVRCIRVVQTPERVVEGILCIIIILREELLELRQHLRGASRSLDSVRNDPRPRLMDTSRLNEVKRLTRRDAEIRTSFNSLAHWRNSRR